MQSMHFLSFPFISRVSENSRCLKKMKVQLIQIVQTSPACLRIHELSESVQNHAICLVDATVPNCVASGPLQSNVRQWHDRKRFAVFKATIRFVDAED